MKDGQLPWNAATLIVLLEPGPMRAARGQASSSDQRAAAQARAATARSPLTVDWIFGDEGSRVASRPPTAWLDTGAVMLLDTRKPEAQRAFEVVDPATGTRHAVLDMARAMSAFEAAGGARGTAASLPWPTAFDGPGTVVSRAS